MITNRKISAMLRALVMGAVLMTPAWAMEDTLDQEAIAYRKHQMNTLDAQFQALMFLITKRIPADNLTSHLEAIAVTARMGLPVFEKRAPGGSSQPFLWDRWDDYTMHQQEFEATIALAIEASKSSDLTQLIWYLDQISCRKCHDIYRQPQVRGRDPYLGR